MAKIKMHRPSIFMGRARGFKIYVDGVNLGSVSNGSSVELEISEGQHEMYCKQDFLNSIEVCKFSINANETKSFTASYQTPIKTMAFFVLAIAISLISAEAFLSLIKISGSIYLSLCSGLFALVSMLFLKQMKLSSITISEN
jgi:hypothetical protein